MAKITRLETRVGVRWVLDFSHDGRRRRKWFDSKRAADAALSEVQRPGWRLPETLPLFKEMAGKLLEGKRDLRAGSYRNAHLSLENHLLPKFGHKRLDTITVPLVETWLATLKVRSSTAGNLISVGAQVFLEAERLGRWTGTNPFRFAKRPRTAAQEVADDDDGRHEDSRAIKPVEVPTLDEVRRILDAADSGWQRPLLTLAAATGLRRGELIGLRLGDLQFDPNGAGKVSVTRSISRTKGPDDTAVKTRVYRPKTAAGERVVPVPSSAAHEMKKWLLARPAGSDWLFPGVGGAPLTGDIVYLSLKRACERAKVRHFKVHALRHFFCSVLIGRGVAPLRVSALAGHRNLTITFSTYAHWLPTGADEPLIDVLANTLDTQLTVETAPEAKSA